MSDNSEMKSYGLEVVLKLGNNCLTIPVLSEVKSKTFNFEHYVSRKSCKNLLKCHKAKTAMFSHTDRQKSCMLHYNFLLNFFSACDFS